MEYSFIKFNSENGVANIVLNRPDVLNSFHHEMALEFQQALDACHQDKSIRAVKITGSGRAFSAGQDLSAAVAPGAASIGEIVKKQYNPIIEKITHLEKPVVCAVNGVAAGAGANIALACDIVMAAKSASFLQAFSKIGLIPDSGGTYFLPRLVGTVRASAMMMLAEKISAEEAWQFGMIYKVCDDDKLQEESGAVAARLAVMPTKGLALTKKAIRLSWSNSLEEQLKTEMELQSQAGNTFDYKEGVAAFLEKRKPEFKGE